MASTLPDDSHPSTTGVFRAEPPVRQRIADHVFESLARAILAAELKPGEPLATQRDLAKQFNVSALVVRQAIHRLEDLGLVRVRQGSATIVLDPDESTDIRLIQLQMELSAPEAKLATDALENQALFMLPLLVLAQRRISEQEVAALRDIIASVSEKPTPEEIVRFRVEFWRQVAKATQNRLFQRQVRWWSTLIKDLERQGRAMRAPPGPLNLRFYRTLSEKLAAHAGAVEYYLERFGPIFDWMDSQRGLTKKKPAADEGAGEG